MKITGDNVSVYMLKNSKNILNMLGDPFIITISSNEIILFVERKEQMYTFLSICEQVQDKKDDWTLKIDELSVRIQTNVFML